MRKVIGNHVASDHYIYQVRSTTIKRRKEEQLVQIRINFCFRKMIDLSSNSSADSSDDYRYGTGTGTGTRSRMFREQQRNGKRKRAESVQSDDERIYFGYPAVFDMECSECSGNSLYRHCIRRISTFLKDDINGKEVEFGLFVKRNDGGEGRVRRDDMLVEPSNSSRNTTTLTVEFTENEYRSVVDLEKTVDDISFETLSDQKPKNGIDLDDCLKLYTAAEVLDDVVWKCPSCKKTVCLQFLCLCLVEM